MSVKEQVKKRLIKSNFVSGGELEKELGVSRTAIWKAVNSLCSEGYKIEAVDRQGYKFISDGDVLDGFIIGDKTLVLDSVDSTNKEVKRRNKDGLVVVAKEQTQGLGRKNRLFCSPVGGIYMSTALSVNLDPKEISFLTICAALAVVQSLKEVCDIKAEVKWVNDIFIENKKVCGISCEASLSMEDFSIERLVIGVGINVDIVPNEVKDIATCVYSHTKKRDIKNKLVASILGNLAKYIGEFLAGKKKELLKEYKKALFILGKVVHVSEREEYSALAVDLNDDGNLIVDRNGERITLVAGEVSLVMS